jgi:hypothetical protein
MQPEKPSFEDLRAEERKIREIQILSTLVVNALRVSNLTLFECTLLLKAAKRFVLSRFPDKEELYEMIYGSRFRRALRERIASSSERN